MWSVGVSWAGASQLHDGGKHHGDVVGREADRQTDSRGRGRQREHELSEGLAPGMASGFRSCTQIYEGLS